MSQWQNHKERAHSKLGASSTEKWFSCPASIRMEADIPEPPESPYAREGTVAHELAEHCMVEGIYGKDMIGEEFQGFTVNEEMAEAVDIYIKFIEKVGGDGKQLYLEERFTLDHIDSELFGTNDACVAEPFGTLYVIDFKYGKGIPVEAHENKQLMYYAIGAARGGDYKDVELVIVQPRCEHPEGPIRRSRISMQRLEEFEKELKEAVDATRQPDAPLVPSEKGCKWCKAKATCPALKSKALEVAKADFDDNDEIVLPNPNELNGEELAKVLKYSKLIGDWIKTVEAHAHARAERGTPLKGYKLVNKRSNRKWINEQKTIELCADLWGEDVFQPKKLKTPAQLQKIIGKEEVDRLTTKPHTGTVLVSESDKRKAIDPSSILDFQDEI